MMRRTLSAVAVGCWLASMLGCSADRGNTAGPNTAVDRLQANPNITAEQRQAMLASAHAHQLAGRARAAAMKR